MPVTETSNTSSDPVPNSDLSKPENSLVQENISLYGHLFLAALTDGEDIKKAINPDEKLDPGTVDAMRGKRLATTDVERRYNSVVNGLSVHERTEKWKDKSFQEAYSQWGSNLLSSINQSESQERKDLISKFFNKDSSEVKDEDIKVIYDKYCRSGSNIDDFVKKAVEGESSSTEVEWLAKKLFGTKSGEITRRIYEIEADFRKAPSIDNAIQKANEIFWVKGLDRFNNPNDEEKEFLQLLLIHFKESDEKTTPAAEEVKPNTETATPPEAPGEIETEKKAQDIEGAPPTPVTEETKQPSPESISPTVEPLEPKVEKTDEEDNGAPPPIDVAGNEVSESPIPVAEVKPVEPAQTPEPTIQPNITEPEKPPLESTLNNSLETPEPANQPPPSFEPTTTEPNTEPAAGAGNPWPPANVEPIKTSSGSILQRIIGRFSR